MTNDKPQQAPHLDAASEARAWLDEGVCCDIADHFQRFKPIPERVVASLAALLESRETAARREVEQAHVSNEWLRESARRDAVIHLARVVASYVRHGLQPGYIRSLRELTGAVDALESGKVDALATARDKIRRPRERLAASDPGSETAHPLVTELANALANGEETSLALDLSDRIHEALVGSTYADMPEAHAVTHEVWEAQRAELKRLWREGTTLEGVLDAAFRQGRVAEPALARVLAAVEAEVADVGNIRDEGLRPAIVELRTAWEEYQKCSAPNP